MRSLQTVSILVTLCVASSACVLDRTGQSAAALYRTEMSEQRVRMSNIEGQFEALDQRVSQIEEYNRSRGQSEIRKMENLEELREELALLRGEFEVLVFEVDQSTLQGLGAAADTEFRLMWLEDRATLLETSLGIKKPAAPGVDASPGSTMSPSEEEDPSAGESSEGEGSPPDRSSDEASVDTAGAGSGQGTVSSVSGADAASGTTGADSSEETDASAGSEESVKVNPKTLIQLAENHLKQGREADARAAIDRYLELYPDHEDVPRALYRHAESYFNEGDYSLAANGFKSVVDRYRDNKWAPYALLRQGECFEAMGQLEDAEAFYRAVVQLWPTGRASREAKSKIAALEKDD